MYHRIRYNSNQDNYKILCDWKVKHKVLCYLSCVSKVHLLHNFKIITPLKLKYFFWFLICSEKIKYNICFLIINGVLSYVGWMNISIRIVSSENFELPKYSIFPENPIYHAQIYPDK